MTILEELADKTRCGAEKVCKFTLDTVDKAKLKARISVLKNRITNLYARIGKIVYEERNSGFSDETKKLTDELILKITSLKEEISECEDALFEMRNS